ncbi:hypothetical protein Q3G72_024081 [Acer saccharum]|nr:hypothetical protein Q3G72_024081 [Acer saccharum]
MSWISRSVLVAFFLGKALAEALNKRVESAVGEFLSTVGRLQAEKQKQVQEFQVLVVYMISYVQKHQVGLHIQIEEDFPVFSVKLDEWTGEQVDTLGDMGGNTAANDKYEACIPDDIKKPGPDSSIQERSDFIRWGRMQSDSKSTKKSNSLSVKTRVIKNNLNPVWNESLMLSIPENIPPLKVLVYDKDTFSTDDFMGEAEIDIQPLVTAARAYEKSDINESMQLGKWVASKENTLVDDGIITLEDGMVKQEINLRLQNVERGVLEIELECVPLTQ